jgi:hypothetical protein
LQHDDELSRAFLDMLSPKESESSTTGAREKVLLLPFSFGGGNVRRLGEGEAFAWQLAHHLLLTMQSEILSKDFLRKKQPGEPLDDVAALMVLAREKGATHIVWGELQSFAIELIVHGQVAEVKTETVKRVSSEQEGMNGRLEAAARVLTEQVASVIAQQQNERKP